MIYFFAIIILMVVFGMIKYPEQFGGYVVRLTTTIESSLYGLTPTQVSVAGVNYYLLASSTGKTPKPALLLLHGFSADHTVWLRCAKHLTKDYHVIIPDLAGHGQTGYQADANYSIPAQTERVAQLIDVLGLNQVHIAGNSMGGFIAAQFAISYPEKTLSIICIDPAGVTPPQPSQLQTLAQQGRNPFFMDHAEQFPTFFELTMAKPPYIPNSVKLFKAHQYVARRPELEHIAKDFYDPDHLLDEKLQHILCPVLMLWGAKDAIIDISCAPVWQEKTQAVSIVWDDLGHMPMLEAPKQTADEIIRFITH